MIRRLLQQERGYSLVEVIVSILILSVAIIPMVGMFDAGLRAATSSGNYDKARSFANERLENAKSLDYASLGSNVFPNGAAPSSCGIGCRRYDVSSIPSTVGLPTGSSYRIEKQYLEPPSTNPSASSVSFGNSSDGTDKGLMKVTVTVNWNSNNYRTSGVVAE